MSGMTVLLLDPRWPTLLPAQLWQQQFRAVEFGEEIPTAVTQMLESCLQSVLVDDAAVPRLFVAWDANSAWVEDVLSNDDSVCLEVPSRQDPAYQAQLVMQQALARGEWEQAQTHTSLMPYLKEETEELTHAIEAGEDDHALCSELGDVLLQILFHAEIARRRGAFEFSDVAASFVAKLQRRSPYLFDGSTGLVPVAEQERLWELGKACES